MLNGSSSPRQTPEFARLSAAAIQVIDRWRACCAINWQESRVSAMKHWAGARRRECDGKAVAG
jgi:hypothetical protein